MIDEIDLQILQLLKENSRLQWKEIGEIIHMTGQGVAARIRKMEALGVIEKYTLQLNDKKIRFGVDRIYHCSYDYNRSQRLCCIS